PSPVSFSRTPPPPRSTLFPYTTLFRSTKQWLQANIWILHDRIVYVGDGLPANDQNVEIVDCTGKYLVPGYIEPHAHPFQLYNPEDRKSTRLNSSHVSISYAVFCLKKKK